MKNTGKTRGERSHGYRISCPDTTINPDGYDAQAIKYNGKSDKNDARAMECNGKS